MAGPTSSSGSPLLSVRDVSVRFGGIVALDGVTFDVTSGQIAGLIGPNGAGKTTLFNCLSRLYTPNGGDILFEGVSILNRPRHDIPRIGIGRTFQNVALFDRLSVLDNVRVGCHSVSSTSFLDNALRLPKVAPEEAHVAARAHELIAFMDLVPFTNAMAGGLPFPIRKRVELARALASSPKLLLLDEPAAGLNHEEIEVLKGQIRRVRDTAARHRAAGRASHEPGHVGVGQGGRHRLRQEDRRRHPGRGAARSRSDPCLPGDLVMAALLEVKGLKAFYGQTQSLYDVGFEIEPGGITTLLGANGAGKTTTLRAICNMVRREGLVRFDGKDIKNMPTEEVVRLRIAHVPEGRGTFTTLTVDENLRIAAYTRRDKAGVKRELDRVFSYFPRLQERVQQQAGTLSGGEQQMLAIARALMLGPRLMLLDEPSFGLAPLIVVEIFRILRRINEEEKVSILLVEQNAALALDLADHAYVLETGHVVMSGPSAVVKNDENIRKSYLGY